MCLFIFEALSNVVGCFVVVFSKYLVRGKFTKELPDELTVSCLRRRSDSKRSCLCRVSVTTDEHTAVRIKQLK